MINTYVNVDDVYYHLDVINAVHVKVFSLNRAPSPCNSVVILRYFKFCF